MPDVCVRSPFIHPPTRSSQLEGQKGELISISRRGRVYSQTSLPPTAGDGGCRSFPFDSLSLALFLFSLRLSPFPTALLTALGPVIIFHLLVFIFFRLFSGALRGKRWNEELALHCSYSRIVARFYSRFAHNVFIYRTFIYRFERLMNTRNFYRIKKVKDPPWNCPKSSR